LRVVAEGVETQEELEFLQARQCEEAQGFYFSRPVPSEQFANLLATGILGPVH
jgi:EAL domain-containing protein (putative c-di-GMP-specific phosphodiesterase class I)